MTSPRSAGATSVPAPGGRGPAVAEPLAAVAAGDPAVLAACREVLFAGGNAFDAAVAGGFASSVAEPALTSLGGGGFLLAHPAGGRPVLHDFFVDAPGRGRSERLLDPHFVPVTVRFPGAAQVFNAGLGSCATPGLLAGLLRVHARLGRLPLAEVVAPALRLAREGVALSPHQASFVALLEPIFLLQPEGRRLFAPEGRLLRAGERHRNPELADFLAALPDSAAEFYGGAIARRIEVDMEHGDGWITRRDLDAYRVVERAPLAAHTRGWRLFTNPPPSRGGVLVALSLALLEAMPEEQPACLRLAEVMCEVEGLRERGEDSLRLREFLRGTTHLSVCDAEGHVASMTTSNGEGSGYFAPGTGIHLNNMMGEDDLHPEGFFRFEPGLRVASMMAPSVLVEGGAGRGRRVALGSGGSKRIRTALFQTAHRIVTGAGSLREIVEAPRLHFDGEVLQVEPGMGEAALTALRERFRVHVWPTRDLYFGGVQVASTAGEAAADPRRGGAAEVFPTFRPAS